MANDTWYTRYFQNFKENVRDSQIEKENDRCDRKYFDNKNFGEHFGAKQHDPLSPDNLPASVMVYSNGRMTYILSPDGNHADVTGRSSLEVWSLYDEKKKQILTTL